MNFKTVKNSNKHAVKKLLIKDIKTFCRDHKSFFTTNSEIESLHVAASLILIEEKPLLNSTINWKALSPELTELVLGN